MPGAIFDEMRSPIGKPIGKPSFEHVGWFDEMIVDRDYGVTMLTRFGVRQKERRPL